MSCKRNCIRRSAAALLIAGVGFSVAARADEGADYRKLLNEKAPTLVTLKFVLKVQMGPMGAQESESEITGVMISAKGLVLCSNTQLGGFTAMMSRMMGARGGDITATPTDLKVLIGDDVEGIDAELIARDSELDLAWVRIKEPGDKKFPYVDFSSAADAKIGQRLVMVRRIGKHFARVAVVGEDRIGGITKKPRRLFIPAGNLGAGLGLPVYAIDGRVVGLAIVQMPDAEEAEANPPSMLSMQDMMAGVILPADNVAKATRRALESADSDDDSDG